MDRLNQKEMEPEGTSSWRKAWEDPSSSKTEFCIKCAFIIRLPVWSNLRDKPVDRHVFL